ncbi:MAG: sulfatase [Planctomycetes bacterium]|nr:sulfatase [Planctomycetota bacterium]
MLTSRVRTGVPVDLLHRTATLLLITASVYLSIHSETQAHSADQPRLPNFVIIFADDLGYADLNCFGSSYPDTPNLDQMAREGRRFTSFCVAQAVCSASRTALLTGCYPNRVGILGALGPGNTHGIHADEMTIAEVLKPQGYATAIYGKWHLGHHPQFLPTRHGFDEYFGLPYSNDMWPRHPTAKFPDLPLIEGERTVELNPDQTKLTTSYTERALKFIEANRDRPFFLYVPHAMPHVPLFVSDKYAGKSSRGIYGDVIREIDWSVGQILQTLKRLKIDENTLVIFTSDNGPWLSYGPHGGSALPLREGKGTAWEGGVREPCVMRWSGKIPPGTECAELAATIDLLPTLAGLAGADLPTRKLDGLDIRSLILGESPVKSPHEAYWYYWGDALHAIRSGPWKLHFPHPYVHVDVPGQAGLPGKLVQLRTPLALYNLEQDLSEANDVSAQHPEIVAHLTALAELARDDLGDSLQKRIGKNIRPAGQLTSATGANSK